MPDTGLAPSNALVTLPNIISFARLCAVPLAIWLVLHQRFPAAFLLFALAGISDAIDGWLARRRGGTVLGAILDPLADKALMVGMYVTLAAIGQLPDLARHPGGVPRPGDRRRRGAAVDDEPSACRYGRWNFPRRIPLCRSPWSPLFSGSMHWVSTGRRCAW